MQETWVQPWVGWSSGEGKSYPLQLGWQKMRWLDGITDSMDMSLSKLWEWCWTGKSACCSPRGCKESDMTEQLNWTELNPLQYSGLENTTACVVHGVTKSQTCPSNIYFHFFTGNREDIAGEHMFWWHSCCRDLGGAIPFELYALETPLSHSMNNIIILEILALTD